MMRNKTNLRYFLSVTVLSAGILLAGCSGSSDGNSAASSSSSYQETDSASFSEAESPEEIDNGVAGDIAIDNTEILESEYLVLSSLYTSTIKNPDCDNTYQEEIPTIEVTNTSGQYLLEAAFSAEMSDGSELTFLLKDLPAGETAEIFDSENHSLESGVTCIQISCTSEKYLEGSALPEGLTIEASGSDAIITNNSGEALSGATVVYRCSMGEQYLGGVSYETSIDILDAGASYQVSDENLMGEVRVVRVYQ